MLVSEFQTNIADVMEDTGFTQYTEASILLWLQDAIRQLAAERPDEFTTTKNLQLLPASNSSGPFQVGAADLRLIKIVRNMGAAGNIIGKAVRGPVKQEEQDLVNPDWHTEPSVGWMKEYIWDETSPRQFYSYPQVPTSGFYVEVVVASMPVIPTESTDTIAVEDTYIPALTEWVQFRLFSRDNEDTGAYQKAQIHANLFFALIGSKKQVDFRIAPKVEEQADAKV
jgi:hypothetical protein